MERCVGCLVDDGRRISDLDAYWKSQYSELILREPAGMTAAVRLCWECRARLTSASAFVRQVRSCQRELKDCARDGLTCRPPRLTTTSVDSYDCQRIKNEEPNASDENCTYEEILKLDDSNHFTHSDDEQLSNIADKTKETDRLSERETKEMDHLSESETKEMDHLSERETKEMDRLSECETKETDHLSERTNDGLKTEDATIDNIKGVKTIKNYKKIVISYEVMLHERKLIEESELFRTSEYKCNTCLVVFKVAKALDKHNRLKHSEVIGAHSCFICGVVLPSEEESRRHEERHMRRYVCCQCGHSTASVREAHRHQRGCHMVGVDAIKLKKENKLKSSTSNTNGVFQCDQCSKVFRWRPSLLKHTTQHRILAGELAAPRCEPCQVTFRSYSCLAKHVKTSASHQIRLKLGGLEDVGAADTRAVAAAVRDQLSRFSCPHCQATFQYKGNLNRHVRSHQARASGELICAPCNKKFSSIATYHNHLTLSKKHVSSIDEWRFGCSECEKRFPTRRKLSDHVAWQHRKTSDHQCQTCHRLFSSHSSLYLHRQSVHLDGGRALLCDLCGKAFVSGSKLREHQGAVHSSELPYECDRCPARFAWQSCVWRHIKVVHEKVKIKRKPKTKNCKETDADVTALSN